MAQRSDVARGRDIIARWCAVAEQRLTYLTEMFETGRWRRYYSEAAFLENIKDAKKAVEAWQLLLTREASLDNSAIDVSWLDRPKGTPLLKDRGFYNQVRQPPLRVDNTGSVQREQPAAVAAHAAAELPVLHVSAPRPEKSWNTALDVDVMQQRYPLLRNAM